MKVINANANVSTAFSEIYKEMTQRASVPFNLVYQAIREKWDITGMGMSQSIRLGEFRSKERPLLAIHPMLPERQHTGPSKQIMVGFDQTLEAAFLTSYFLLASKGMVNLPDLWAKFPEFDKARRDALEPYMDVIDDILDM